jgi:hypothetical protein
VRQRGMRPCGMGPCGNKSVRQQVGAATGRCGKRQRRM